MPLFIWDVKNITFPQSRNKVWVLFQIQLQNPSWLQTEGFTLNSEPALPSISITCFQYRLYSYIFAVILCSVYNDSVNKKDYCGDVYRVNVYYYKNAFWLYLSK